MRSPDLRGFLDKPPAGKTLEIGVAHGTVARFLSGQMEYHAVDIAAGPIEMARDALRSKGKDPSAARLASALDLPFDAAAFDSVVAIGSLHHTGDLPRALSEVGRVLRPGGAALIMVYNAHSLNRVVTAPITAGLSRIVPSRASWLKARTYRDLNSEGKPAPHTDFVTTRRVKELLHDFESVRVSRKNANAVTVFGRTVIPRVLLLPVVGSVAGLDLYVSATR